MFTVGLNKLPLQFRYLVIAAFFIYFEGMGEFMDVPWRIRKQEGQRGDVNTFMNTSKETSMIQYII